jgi:RHS repeat-associated protein
MYLTNYRFYNPKNYLYSKPVKGFRSFGVSYGFAFNGKELDKGDEGMGGGGSTYDYGFRIYNPNLGRFLSLDPIAKEFPWNSPYSYAENDVIRSIDLDGLEKVVVVMDQNPGKTEFEANVTYLETQSYAIIRVATGADIIKGLEKYTIDGGKPIENLVILAHASAGGLYGINGDDNGLYLPGTIRYVSPSINGEIPSELGKEERKKGAASSCDLQTSIKQEKVVFADGAVILFGGCNTGKKNTDGMPGFAEVTAQELSITTIGANSITWDGGPFKVPGDTDNKDIKCSTRSTRQSIKGGWNMFTPESDGTVSITALSTADSKGNGGRQPMNVTGCTLR